jgi:N-acetyl sugar amidotransferase
MIKDQEYKQCARCVMDTSDPYITFDEKGYCNHCIEFFEKTSKLVYQGESSDKELEIMVQKIKNSVPKGKYDCLIGISGGVDSCYVAYKAKQLGLNPLAVHMDNGWNSEEAVNNIKKVCTKLNIDYQSYVLDWEEFRDIQLAFLKSSIVEIEIPTDTAIPAALHKVADEHNIKYIISGGNYATEGILPDSWFYDPKDLKLLKSIHKQFGTKPLKTFPAFDYKKEIYYKMIKGIKIFYLLNYLPFSKEGAMNILKDKLDWKYYGGKHYESKFTGFVQSYIQPVKFNVDYRKATFSTQICTGEISREEAIEALKKPPYNPDKIGQEKEYVAKKLGLTPDEFEEILNSPPKTYRDYPNDEKMLKFIYKFYRKYISKKNNEFYLDNDTCLICSSKDILIIEGYERAHLVKCKNCSFIFSSKKPSNEELIEHYNHYLRNDYLSPITVKRYNELLDSMEKYRKTNNILDIGCGVGYFLEQAKKRGWNVYGTEFTDDAVRICQEKGIEMFQGVLNSDYYKSEFFDVVTSFEVIEHINNPKEELNNISNILRKDGLFYCTTPNFNSFSRRYLKDKWNNILYPEHLSYYTKQTISRALKQFDLVPLKTVTTGVSLVRLKTSKKGLNLDEVVTPGSLDESIRSKFEKNSFFKIVKLIANSILTLDTIKIFAEKK